MVRYVVGLTETDPYVDIVGGKAAHLAELSSIEGIRVPAGFCVTTDAFEQAMAEADGIVERIAVPDDVAAEIKHALAQLGEQAAYAVRSSATAEDSPTASFAGLYDTYLNVVGAVAVLQHVARCWASLLTERAVSYRAQQGIDQRHTRMAVVVQQMVFPQAAGTLFTADPATSHRKVACVEASFGLGEAVVAGLVNPDVYKVRDGRIITKTIATKERAIYAGSGGGTEEHAIEPERQQQPALTDSQVIELAAIGRRIEAHFGQPQDIEWCLVDDEFHIVQSRPITTLFPIPAASDDGNHVYVSVGHQQMMTDPMKPLGISLWQLTSAAPMRHAGGRLFVDVTQHLASPTNRPIYLRLLGTSDPLIGDALQTIIDRDDFIPLTEESTAPALAGSGTPTETAPDPSIVDELIARREVSLETLKRDIRSMSGPALLDFILADLQELRRFLAEPESKQVVAAAIEGSLWLNEHLQTWLGEKNAVGTLTQSVPHNVTSEMGLGLLAVADVIRPYPDVIAYLQDADDDRFLEALPTFEGGQQARDAIEAYLAKYGMRCVGEIDITRPRWSERPTTLVPLILADIRNFEPGAGKRMYEQGLQQAAAKEQELLTRLRALPDGEQKAHDVKRMIDRIRAFVGFREYPKYHMISRYFVYRQALLQEAERLVHAHVLQGRDDIYYLTFQELHGVVRTNHVDRELIRERKDAFASYKSLTPPRVLTSDGEIVTGCYRRDKLPPNALPGLAVSAGSVEGRARVVSDIAAADLEPGDILVTAYTDPSWTPAFVAIAGLVTEVGGLMTHGAVIAREYGLPAVVGVEQATRLIRDGQRIRVHGTDGYVELLD